MSKGANYESIRDRRNEKTERDTHYSVHTCICYGFWDVLADAAVSCKTLCQAALKKTGGESKLKYQSAKAEDFGGFSASDRKKVSSVMYVCDEKEAYSLCVAKASSNSDAADLLKSLKSYKSANSSSDYLSDYSSDEQKVFKNALCGRKGKYVWYIAMSSKKSVNKKGQTALKEKL